MVGAARRLVIQAKAREVRGADRVVVRDGEAIGVLLEKMGAVSLPAASLASLRKRKAVSPPAISRRRCRS